jgi:flagellar biosynthesis/type III secretory pathway chaperone
MVAFIALLERERQLLVQPQIDALEVMAGQKQALLNQMAMASGAEHAGRQDPALHALAARAQQLNAANARLLALHRASCESRLHLLRGGPTADSLYRANGFPGT